MTHDELADLMAEPPGGENHGRTRAGGSWRDLGYDQHAALEEHYEYVIHVPIHGLRSTYVHEGCRCEACTRANSEYFQRRRNT